MSVRIALFCLVGLGLVACLSLTLQVVRTQPVSFHGHTDSVHAVVAAPDAKTLASVGGDGTIKLWDVATRKELATFLGRNPTFSPDGQTLARTDDKTIRLWGVSAGAEQGTLRGHTEDVYSLAFSPDGQTLASGSRDTTVKLWDLATGTERATLRGHAAPVDPVAFSPDGRTLASGSRDIDPSVKLWDVTTGKARWTVKIVGSWGVESMAFSPDGQTLASGGELVRLWDVVSGTNTATLESGGDGMEGLTFSPDGKTLAAVDLGSREIRLWDVASGKKTATIEKRYRRPRPRLLRYVWDTFPGFFEEYSYVPQSLVFTLDGGIMAFGHDNRDPRTVKLWQAAAAPGGKK